MRREQFEINKIKIIAQGSMAICMALILNFITIFKMPFGGSVTFGHMIPLIFFTFKNGAWHGFLIGCAYGSVKALLSFSFIPSKNIMIFVFAFLLDYIIPYAMVGISYFIIKKFSKNKKSILILTCVLTNAFRLLSTVVSGVFIWKQYFPGNVNLWGYSIVYNLLYIVPEVLISVFICFSLSEYL